MKRPSFEDVFATCWLLGVGFVVALMALAILG